ncbi:MAG: DUF4292 domain-containing protein [Saprospirales bacterium]|nr:MAG: DUF4292 domain-containing protein [Saprospirales bacterium]
MIESFYPLYLLQYKKMQSVPLFQFKLSSSSPYIFGLVLFLALGMGSCKSKRAVVESPAEELTAEKLIREVSLNEFSAPHIDARARMDVSMDGQSYTFRAHIRSIQDSAIWVRATILGFEVGRVMITPDTFHLIDRVNREYVKLPMDVVAHRYGIDIGFRHLQQLLLGSPSFDDVVIRDLRLENPRSFITGFYENMQVLYEIDNRQRVQRFNLKDGNGRILESVNNDYQAIANAGYFAFDRKINGTDGIQNFSLNCEFLELNIDEVPSLPFDVPSRFDRVE